MKTKILPIIILALLFGGVAFAQDSNLPNPGWTPDNPFYFLERVSESVRTFFTFGDIKKAERYTALATERLAEAQAMVEKEKPELVEKTLARYENQLVKASLRVEKAKTKGKNTEEVTRTITEATQKHHTVLEKVLEKVPEEAKPAIRHAMIVSTKEGLERAVEVSKQGDTSTQNYEVIKAKCLEQGGPPEMCTSLVNNLRNPKSPRVFCAEMGGPSEICEKIPLSFDSFEAIEAYCLESGGPPDQCAVLVGKCEEFGITTPDACFRFLSTAAITTYKTTAPTSVPASTWSEKEMEEGRIQREIEEASRRKAAEEEKFSSGQLETLAKCLTGKGVRFYGSENCSYCKKQKEMFGDAATFLPYIECTTEETRPLCNEAEIKGFPTWDFPGKEKVMGIQLPRQLTELSGCSL